MSRQQFDGRAADHTELLLTGMALQIKRRADGSYAVLLPAGVTVEAIGESDTRVLLILERDPDFKSLFDDDAWIHEQQSTGG